jgi:3-isopropylmalate dehydrogenase
MGSIESAKNFFRTSGFLELSNFPKRVAIKNGEDFTCENEVKIKKIAFLARNDSMTPVKIVAIGGDFIGPEVIKEGLKVLKNVVKIFNLNLEVINIDGGGNYYLKHGVEWEEGSYEQCKEADAILFGAIGHPKARLPNNHIAGANIILGLRQRLDLFANIRPTKLYPGVKHKLSTEFRQIWEPKNVNFTIVRENTEGLYSSPFKHRLTVDSSLNQVIDERLITRKGSKRVIELAFQYADYKQSRAPGDNVKRLTAIHKNNLLVGCQLFMDEFYSIASLHKKIVANDILVDSFAQDVLRSPEKYSTCVTTNSFGDILTDLVSTLAGGMGMAPSGQINGWSSDSHGLFEPIHGSAPDIAGKQIANPIAAILSVSMMLEWLGRKKSSRKYLTSAKSVENAVTKLLHQGDTLPIDIGGRAKTSQVGDAIVKLLKLNS